MYVSNVMYLLLLFLFTGMHY